MVSFLFSFLFNIAQAQENKIYVMSIDAQPQAFKAQLDVDSNGKSYIDFFLTDKPQWAKVQKLQQSFEIAQKSYLTQTLQDAIEQFKKIVEQRFDEDWDQAQIKMIHYALLRLAQHDANHEQWLEEAIKWNPNLEPDADLFPPTFVADWQSRKQNMKMTTWDLDLFKKNGEVLVVNGDWIQSQDFIMRADGVYRFTLVSNRYLPLTIKGTFKDFVAKFSNRLPFVRGTCATPEWNSQVQEQNLKVFFSTECQIALREKKKPLELNPTPTFAQNSLVESYPSPKSTSLLQSKWFWIGAAVVGGFVAYKYMQPQKRAPEPTNREGF